MPVGVDGECDAGSVFAGHLEVEANVALRIEHERLAGRLVSDQVRRVTQAFQVELMQEH